MIAFVVRLQKEQKREKKGWRNEKIVVDEGRSLVLGCMTDENDVRVRVSIFYACDLPLSVAVDTSVRQCN